MKPPTPGCHVTTGLRNDRRKAKPVCGLPVVAYGLCAGHYAERVRLGGKP